MKRNRKRLNLTSETMRVLTTVELHRVDGGAVAMPSITSRCCSVTDPVCETWDC